MHGHFRHTPTVCNCRSFGCVLLLNQIYLTTMYRYHSDLSDQIRIRIRVRLILAFLWRTRKTDTLSSANFKQDNILLKERTQTINNKIKLHILGVPMSNWLITSPWLFAFAEICYRVRSHDRRYTGNVHVQVVEGQTSPRDVTYQQWKRCKSGTWCLAIAIFPSFRFCAFVTFSTCLLFLLALPFFTNWSQL